MSKKEVNMDRRVKYTKKIIKDTFLDLLSKKDITKITVSEICKIADINRATFYRYYVDVFNLLDSIEDEFVKELKKAYQPNFNEKKTIYGFSKAMLTVFLENKELVKILFNTNNNLHFLNDVLEVAFDRCKERWEKDLPELSQEDMEYAAIFIFNGALGVLNFWVKNDFDKNIDEISEIIETLSCYGTRRFIYKR